MPWRKRNKLRLVPESEATGRIREIYLQIKETLGVPYVSTMFQAFAAYPRFLDRVWQAMGTAARKQQFYRLGDGIRAEAYTRAHNYFPVPDLCALMRAAGLSDPVQREITQVVELFHYLDPLALLMTVVQMRAFEAPVGRETPDSHIEHPEFAQLSLTTDDENASARIRATYDDINRTLHMPALTAAYRASARYPDFLESYWRVLKPISQSAIYTQCQIGLKDTAWSLVEDFPVRVELTVARLAEEGMPDDDITAVVRLTEVFADVLSSQVLNLALAKVGLDGGSQAVTPPPIPAQNEPKQAA